ncbi:MAG: MotA/TolQ/ExbB proton channel family protein [Candidatus Eremiobacteraeota bacterium]|nr:MotA/TolQ/ExbB proton channel family protein [Candidatus Eremiobacteraeota bacterium]
MEKDFFSGRRNKRYAKNLLIAMKEFIELFHKGGPAIWILLVCVLILVWVSLEKILFYNKISGPSPFSFNEILNGKRNSHCYRYSYLYLVGEAELGNTTEERIKSYRDAFMTKVERDLSRGQATLGTISVISPFIGLFGTVIGIMHAFFKIAEKGQMTPAVIGAGIAEALIATAAGLLVAIVSVVMYNFFKAKMDVILADLNILQSETDMEKGEMK